MLAARMLMCRKSRRDKPAMPEQSIENAALSLPVRDRTRCRNSNSRSGVGHWKHSRTAFSIASNKSLFSYSRCSIRAKHLKGGKNGRTHNKSLQVAFDPPPILAAEKTAAASNAPELKRYAAGLTYQN